MPEAPIYFDHHATTPCDPRVVERMLPFFTEVFGNAASLTHVHGRKAANALEDARIAIARFLAAQANEVYFTSGATESNNIALQMLRPGDHFVTTAVEHRSVLAPARRAEARGVETTIISPDREGFVDPAVIAAALRPDTRLVSVEAANGEIGTVQAIGEIGAVCRSRGVLFHSDVTQALGKIALDLSSVDAASFSAHKFYGPKGIGGLYVRRGVRLEPLTVGGGQEKGMRSGTVNVAGAVGMAAALGLRAEEMVGEGDRMRELRDDLRDALLGAVDGVSVNGPRALRLPGNLNVSFDRVEAESLIVAMRRFSLSSGSACSSGQGGPSPVVRAIGLSEDAALGSIRIGLGKANTGEQVEIFVADLRKAVAKLREMAV